ADSLNLPLHALQRGAHVRAPLELNANLGFPAGRGREDPDRPRDAVKRLLERPRDRGHHVLRRLFTDVGDDLDDGARDVRKDRGRQAEGLEDSGRGENREHEKDRGPATLGGGDPVHCWIDTGLPSGRPACPDTTTRAPAGRGGATISTWLASERPVCTSIQ